MMNKSFGTGGETWGGGSTHYCKGSYGASLDYAGKDARNGWDYALDLTWGLRNSCP